MEEKMNSRMSSRKAILTGLAVLFFLLPGKLLHAQVTLTDRSSGDNVFQLGGAGAVQLCYDAGDAVTVAKTAGLFAEDVYKVTGQRIRLGTAFNGRVKNGIIVGTVSGNALIRELVRQGKIDVAKMEHGWEQYAVAVVKRPVRGVEKALVIAGSDRRGAAYGLLSVSEAIGISPWYWWADVPVKERRQLFITVRPFVSKPPSVKYRGIFINDEDWGLLPWAKHTFDPELKDIGPKTYARVFELLLRLKANYLCPAMHEASGAFNKYPENKRVADSFGIVMGSVHPEPLLFNNASEWDKKTMGEWNYQTNKQNILKVLDKRVRENSPYENVYTIALRGMHDKEMEGNYSMKERVRLVGEAVKDQRAILKRHIDKPLDEIPQAFTPYKEVLDIYRNGLELPEDVTIVWPDDNYGYMKQLSNKEEQQRSGRSGVYYHASYLGSPHDYLWLSSTPPNLMYEELSKAYKTGADRLWLLNAGDIKSCEAPVTQFLAMAYRIDDFNFETAPLFRARWLSGIYGARYFETFKAITTIYDRLAFSRKPEFMGWGYEWNVNKYPRERPADTEFSFDHYREAEDRMETCKRMEAMAAEVWTRLPEGQKASFFQLLYYPVKGAGLMNRMWLTAQLQRQYVAEERAASSDLRRETGRLYDSLRLLTGTYNTLLNGKWNRIMSLRQGITASYFEKPRLDSILLPAKGVLKIKPEGAIASGSDLPTFSRFFKKTHFIELYNTGRKPLQWSAKTGAPWIRLSTTRGSVHRQERVQVSVDWDRVPAGTGVQGFVEIRSGNEHRTVAVSVWNPQQWAADSLKGLFLEYNGIVSIPAAQYHRKVENGAIRMQQVDDLGYEGRSVMMGDPVAPMQDPKRSDAPNLQYDFYTFGRGRVKVYTYVLPLFPLSSNRDFGFHESSNAQTKYGISIDDGAVAYPSSSASEYSQRWSENVQRNAAVNESMLYIDKPGKHTLKIICGDPGMVVQKVVIDLGGMKFSYLGPPSTRIP